MEITEAGKLFGARLREIREKKGVTQRQLAEITGIPYTHISSIERGLMLPNLHTVIRLAAALDRKVSAFTSVFDKADLQALLRQ